MDQVKIEHRTEPELPSVNTRNELLAVATFLAHTDEPITLKEMWEEAYTYGEGADKEFKRDIDTTEYQEGEIPAYKNYKNIAKREKNRLLEKGIIEEYGKQKNPKKYRIKPEWLTDLLVSRGRVTRMVKDFDVEEAVYRFYQSPVIRNRILHPKQNIFLDLESEDEELMTLQDVIYGEDVYNHIVRELYLMLIVNIPQLILFKKAIEKNPEIYRQNMTKVENADNILLRRHMKGDLGIKIDFEETNFPEEEYEFAKKRIERAEEIAENDDSRPSIEEWEKDSPEVMNKVYLPVLCSWVSANMEHWLLDASKGRSVKWQKEVPGLILEPVFEEENFIGDIKNLEERLKDKIRLVN